MENLAHTLLGLAMAEAGLESTTPLATTALILSSNLPDLDLVMYPRGDALSYIKYHRGLTHSFIGLIALACMLAVVLTLIDRKIRLKRGPFLRPARPARIFWLALLGGLGHLLMDFTNSYGVRPLMPFSDRWFYGDLVFVVDPWIWLILGFSVVWFTLRQRERPGQRRLIALVWLAIGIPVSAVVALALRHPMADQPALSIVPRAVWFGGLAIVLVGLMFGWGQQGLGYARWSLLFLVVYWGGMWIGHQSAARQAARVRPADVSASATWPEPANPLLWESVCAAPGKVFYRRDDLIHRVDEQADLDPDWEEKPSIDPAIATALERSNAGRTFMSFARMPSAEVIERPDGYSVTLRDARFGLKLQANLDREMNVESSVIRW